MGLIDRLFRSATSSAGAETRASAEDPRVPVSAKNFLQFFGVEPGDGDIPVTIESALGVPAVWAAVNFISSTVAALPLHVYKKKATGPEKVSGPLASLLRDAVNDETTSFDWRRAMMDAVLTGGRHVTFIERAASGLPMNLWPLDPTKTTVRRIDGRTSYDYQDGSRTVTYAASEVIDLTFMRKPNGLEHYSPIVACSGAIGHALAVQRYGRKFFAGGGVPPFAYEGNFNTRPGMNRAGDDLQEAVKEASRDGRLALVLPNGGKLTPLGAEAQKNQLVEVNRFLIEEVARIWSLPPVFVQDLTHGTFSNTEQQDLHLVKHTLTQWTQRIEQQLNLKLFGRTRNAIWVAFNIDGLLRGDFKTRMEGLATGVQNGLLTPDEGRALEERPSLPGGDRLYIQGATVPLATTGPAADPSPAPEVVPPPPAPVAGA